MALDATYVAKPISVTGGIKVAPLGTVTPTDPTSVLNAAFKELGYVTEDGLKLSHDASDDKIKVWGGVTIRTIRSDYSATITGTLVSTLDVDVLKNVFGDSLVTQKSGFIAIKHAADIAPEKVYIIETKDASNGGRKRYVIPKGQIAVSGDVNLSHKEITGFEVTIEALADKDGVCYYEFIESSPASPVAAGVVGG
jgi:hypothetical protein